MSLRDVFIAQYFVIYPVYLVIRSCKSKK